MQSVNVVCVGASSRFVSCDRGATFRVKRCEIETLTHANLRALSPCIVVLGADALASLTPDAVRTAARGLRVVVLALADGAHAVARGRGSPQERERGARLEIARIVLWSRSFVVEFVEPATLRERIGALRGTCLRPPVDSTTWLPTSRTPPRNLDATRLLDALTGLSAPRVAAWAAALSISRHQLNRRSNLAFGESARSVCAAYVRACVAEERRLGRSLAEIADGLGYADASTILRSVASTASRTDLRARVEAVRANGHTA